ncbi:MAG: helix-turn-helix transcriptional regulator [Candidatus Cloacimonetes bacterium]|nr:helix-turn-helix transcriptional regulator [Candidatus Cloacimonadota bacterium]
MENSIASRLKYLREKFGLNQHEYASSLNTTQTVISRYEQGTRLPSVDYLLKVKEKYHVDMDWVLTGEGNMHSSAIERIEVERLREEVSSLKTELLDMKISNKQTLEKMSLAYEDFIERLKQMVDLQSAIIDKGELVTLDK